MQDLSKPRNYNEWRTENYKREEDAAYTFGYHLIEYCRNKAVDNLPFEMNQLDREKSIESINIALHNFLDMVEGFWKLQTGTEHSFEYIIQVLVRDKDLNEIEKINISTGLDLPIGFWKWADGEFR